MLSHVKHSPPNASYHPSYYTIFRPPHTHHHHHRVTFSRRLPQLHRQPPPLEQHDVQNKTHPCYHRKAHRTWNRNHHEAPVTATLEDVFSSSRNHIRHCRISSIESGWKREFFCLLFIFVLFDKNIDVVVHERFGKGRVLYLKKRKLLLLFL